MDDFRPTHIFTTTPKGGKTKAELVMVDDDAGYTANDWAAGEPSASWELLPDGWFCVGRTGNQTWTVEELPPGGWVPLLVYASVHGVGYDTVRRAVKRGMPSRQGRRGIEVQAEAVMPPGEKTGPKPK